MPKPFAWPPEPHRSLNADTTESPLTSDDDEGAARGADIDAGSTKTPDAATK